MTYQSNHADVSLQQGKIEFEPFVSYQAHRSLESTDERFH